MTRHRQQHDRIAGASRLDGGILAFSRRLDGVGRSLRLCRVVRRVSLGTSSRWDSEQSQTLHHHHAPQNPHSVE
jgi:hypothetical protein